MKEFGDREPRAVPCLVAAFLLAAALYSVTYGQTKVVYNDPNAPIEKRVDDLLGRMTLDEKISQLMNDSPAIDRLAVPAYNWWNEALHGVGRAGRATVFPQAIGMAASFDADLMLKVATAISDEARAKNNEFLHLGKRNIYQGLTFWSPNINLFRDPRWGRGMETYGEDPYLTGRMAVAFVKGMQGDDSKYLKTIATAKHFAVHSGPEPARHTFDAVVSDKDLRESYLPQFEAAVREGGAWSVMCAYNSVDGDPACSNPGLFDILRKEWGFKGYVVSDCGAVRDISEGHKKKAGAAEGAAAALLAGTDLNCGIEYTNLAAAVRAGLVKESDIDRALRRLLTARFKLGMFDPPELVKYARIPYTENESAAHAALALEMARKSIVLLKNEGGVLPLKKTLKRVAVIGPNADDFRAMLGNYNGFPSTPVTPRVGISRKLGKNGDVLSMKPNTDLAAGLPTFDVIPAEALRVFDDADDKRIGLVGQYFSTATFNGNVYRPRELTYPNSGVSIGRTEPNPKAVFGQIDPEVDFMWWDGAPKAKKGSYPPLNDDDFGVRWLGFLKAPETGTYQLGAIGMNAWELYLSEKKVADSNSFHGSNYKSAPVELEAGKFYPIQLDYHEYVNDAGIQLVWSRPNAHRDEDALKVAQAAEAVVVVMGLSPRLEGEEMKVPVEGFSGGDRVDLGLPGVQEDLLKKIMALGKPTVLVLMNGSALSINWAAENVPAIVEAWYPGQAGGAAIADVLFGDYNPAGRLPVTVYKSAAQLPPFENYSMTGRTYRYFKGEPLYPFGYGLSYTTFAYRNPKADSSSLAIGENIRVSAEVQNAGLVAGEEVVQLYIKGNGKPDSPIHSLAGIQRVTLQPSERKTVTFTLKPEQMAHVAENGRRTIEPGTVEFSIGGGQPDPKKAKIATVSGTFRLTGTSKIVP